MPEVTVITAAFNAREQLERTVDSVAAQTFSDREHIVVDGASFDGTREYLESLDGQLRWISEPDEGIADALNKCIAMARGEWIIVLQAGDSFLDCDSLAKAVPELRASDMVGFAVRFDHHSGTSRILWPRPLGLLTELRVLNPHQGLFCRRSVFERIGRFDPAIRIGMDYDHLLRAKHSGLSLKVVREVVSVMPGDGISSRDDWRGQRDRLCEQFGIQWRNAPYAGWKVVLLAFWSVFFPAYFLKQALLPSKRFY